MMILCMNLHLQRMLEVSNSWSTRRPFWMSGLTNLLLIGYMSPSCCYLLVSRGFSSLLIHCADSYIWLCPLFMVDSWSLKQCYLCSLPPHPPCKHYQCLAFLNSHKLQQIPLLEMIPSQDYTNGSWYTHSLRYSYDIDQPEILSNFL